MFFLKKKVPSAILFQDLIDIHCHLLPGIDDGSYNLEQSLKMLEVYADLGIKKIFATPHIFKELYPNTPDTIKASYDSLFLNAEATLSFSISYAAEYMIDEDFIRNLNYKHTPLLCIYNNYVLIEIMPYASLSILDEVVFQLQTRNIIPILAHPERYFHVDADFKNFELLKEKGVLLQLNALSMMGHYGKEVYLKASALFQRGLYDFVATDAHHHGHLGKLKNLELGKRDFEKWNRIKENQQQCFSPF